MEIIQTLGWMCLGASFVIAPMAYAAHQARERRIAFIRKVWNEHLTSEKPVRDMMMNIMVMAFGEDAVQEALNREVRK